MSETINPDFRGVDEVVTPPDHYELCGWTDGKDDERTALNKEHQAAHRIGMRMQSRTIVRDAAPMPERWDSFNEYQQSKGRYPGSCDWSLLDEWLHGAPLLWLPQIIGSCVVSNTFRAFVVRQMYQIGLLGMPQEYFGRDEFGPDNYGFYGPWTYGDARKRANMRGSDGLYCGPMRESMMESGVLMCNTPALGDLLGQLRVAGERDYPEPQGNDGARIYRDFGNWKHVEDLRPYADFILLESPMVTNAEQLWALHQKGVPAFVCSMEAIRKIGVHPDGFPIHAENPNDAWAHNMAFHGGFIASDGSRWFRQSNESWGAHHIYNRRFEEVAQSFNAGRLTCAGIGEIRGPAGAPVSVFPENHGG